MYKDQVHDVCMNKDYVHDDVYMCNDRVNDDAYVHVLRLCT